MPQIFKVGSFVIYFWSNENNPTEPIHVHVSEGRASAIPASKMICQQITANAKVEANHLANKYAREYNSTKIWITATGKTLLCNNNSKVPNKILINIMRNIEANSDLIINKWREQFGEIKYYC